MKNMPHSVLCYIKTLWKKVKECGRHIIKRLILAWDPDYTRLTLAEKRRLKAAEKGAFVDAGDIDWANIGI